MDDASEADFVSRALARLPEVLPPPGLNARLLAAYDARAWGLWVRICDLVWPGVPAWAPTSAFAAALLAGVALGAVLPTAADDTRFSLDQPTSFSLLQPDQDEDL
jgi:hypothetical protein